MQAAPSPVEPQSAAPPRWRGLLVSCSLISLVCIFALDAHMGRFDKGGPLVSTPIWLPYLFIVFRLRGRTPKSGLALAVSMGCAMFLPAAWLVLYARAWAASWPIQAGLVAIALAQPVLFVAGIRSWRSRPREKGDWQIIIANAAYAAIALFILMSFLRQAPRRIAEDQVVKSSSTVAKASVTG